MPHISAYAAPSRASLPLSLVAQSDLDRYLAQAPSPSATWLKAQNFTAAAGELILLPAANGGVAGAVIGLGTAQARARLRFGALRHWATLPADSLWHIEGDVDHSLLREFALGWGLSSYRFERYRPAATPKAPPRLVLPTGLDADLLAAEVASEFLTRDLINTPASDLGPEGLERAFHALGAEFGAKTSAIIGADLLAQNFPLIHAVGRASTEAPRLLELRWGTKGPKLTLVGKGVCFDTGGLDLKPSSGMLLMKKDMGGAANVMGLARLIMARQLPLQLRVLVPAVENAVAGNAMRPRDILTSRKGLTVEINNTDAEGRLVLADALTYAREEDSDLTLSMATLTGAARVALGPDLAPYFAQEDRDAQHLEAAAAAHFDPVWRLPFHAPYEAMIEPGIADLDNAPTGGFAGAVTAALFLRRFADHPRYMHFDIYGHAPSEQPARSKGGAAQGVRALYHALPALLGL